MSYYQLGQLDNSNVKKNICNPAQKCNVCAACCQNYIPNGEVCDLCVDNKCSSCGEACPSGQVCHTFPDFHKECAYAWKDPGAAASYHCSSGLPHRAYAHYNNKKNPLNSCVLNCTETCSPACVKKPNDLKCGNLECKGVVDRDMANCKIWNIIGDWETACKNMKTALQNTLDEDGKSLLTPEGKCVKDNGVWIHGCAYDSSDPTCTQ